MESCGYSGFVLCRTECAPRWVVLVAGFVQNIRLPTTPGQIRHGMTAASLAAVTLGTIGLTIYLLTKDADIGADWWNYLIQALASTPL